ncbi:MAG TPA: GNAT family N-acetyltransferase [Anaerolineales bacterium]|nr:GNAT family N-acetyltransferase [Anaerolineales bacterium]HNO94771.1 GNAT family N-acetyltransferase [Anaerolineales bacterium]
MSSLSNIAIKLIPASHFSIDELTGIYNQTRVDYMVPMPMNSARLMEYIEFYDVDLDRSVVAIEDGELRGVAMLGVRAERTWVTRLGVIPSTRRGGVGEALMQSLLEQSARLGIDFTMLEVIKNNVPAHRLFLKLGFYEIGELLILRRAPSKKLVEPVIADARRLERYEALDLVGYDRGTQPWTNQSESMSHAQDISGLYLTLQDGSQGWLVYQRQKFTLTHFIYKTEAGDPATMAYAFLSHLHHQYPRLDTHIENIQVNDPHLPGFQKMGYVESFRRIEMWRGNPPSSIMPSK